MTLDLHIVCGVLAGFAGAALWSGAVRLYRWSRWAYWPSRWRDRHSEGPAGRPPRSHP